jgi:DNA-binding NarL/FixJ family response regulator
MTRRILFVDDEPKVLQGIERQLSGRFELRTAPGPVTGLAMLAKDGPYAAVVSDFRMPTMNGVEFLAKVRQTSPDTVRMMLTGQADLNATIRAVNEGNIFRFLSKPCSMEILSAALTSALEQYRLIQAERELLEQTLHGSIKMMTEVLSLTSPAAFSQACRVRRYAAHIASRLDLRDAWQFEIAAMLCQLGCIAVPPEVLAKVATGAALSAGEQEVFDAHPRVAERLLENIPRLEKVARMIGNQEVGSAPARNADDDLVALGTGLLSTTLQFDRLVAMGLSRDLAIAQMCSQGSHNRRFLGALEDVAIEHIDSDVRLLNVSELKASMIMNQNILTNRGVLLLAQGEELTLPLIARLQNFVRTGSISEPLSVRVPHSADSVSSETPPN